MRHASHNQTRTPRVGFFSRSAKRGFEANTSQAVSVWSSAGPWLPFAGVWCLGILAEANRLGDSLGKPCSLAVLGTRPCSCPARRRRMALRKLAAASAREGEQSLSCLESLTNRGPLVDTVELNIGLSESFALALCCCWSADRRPLKRALGGYDLIGADEPATAMSRCGTFGAADGAAEGAAEAPPSVRIPPSCRPLARILTSPAPFWSRCKLFCWRRAKRGGGRSGVRRSTNLTEPAHCANFALTVPSSSRDALRRMRVGAWPLPWGSSAGLLILLVWLAPGHAPLARALGLTFRSLTNGVSKGTRVALLGGGSRAALGSAQGRTSRCGT